jgi:anaerobic ribonucleoside-triphosphate reductase
MKEHEILQRYKDERRRCIVYTRVMGYHRPVESFNIGKKGEHQERKFFLERVSQNNAA